MKNNDSLDDLIINSNSKSKSFNIKSVLTMLVLILAVLVGAVLLTKTLLQEPQKPKIPLEENLTNNALVPTDINETNGSTTITSSTKETNSSTKEIKDEVIGSTIANAPQTKAVANTKTDVVQKPQEQQKTTKVAIDNTSVPPIKTEEKKTTKTQKNPSETKVEKKVTEPKTKTTPTTQQPQKDSSAKNTPSTTTKETYYVQVGVFAGTPNSEFLDIIKNNGYNLKTTKRADGSTKMLIGPYDSKESADTALEKIQDRINKAAFLVKQ